MPNVGGVEYPYTEKGIEDSRKARQLAGQDKNTNLTRYTRPRNPETTPLKSADKILPDPLPPLPLRETNMREATPRTSDVDNFYQGQSGSWRNLPTDVNAPLLEPSTEEVLQTSLLEKPVPQARETLAPAPEKPTDYLPTPPPPKPEPPKSEGSPLAGIIPSSIRSLVSDVAGFDLNTTRNEDYFGAEEQDVLRQLVAGKIQRSGNRSGNIEYKDYDSKYEGVSFSDTGSALYKLLTGDDEYSIKTTLGQFRYDIDERNHLIITDQYNFNDAEKLQKQNPTDIDRIMNLMAYADNIIDGSVGGYGIVRRAGALWGSKEGEGAKFEIDLGPLAGF